MNSAAHFDQLVQEGLSQELVGWDFAWLQARTRESPLPWDYRRIVLERMQSAGSLLDLGTGGGEFLSALAPLPPDTRATEGYPPNVPTARNRLEPLGVQVVDVSELGKALPFDNGSFDLVTNRHSSFDAWEVQRVLRPNGRYITQQVGWQNCLDLNRFLQEEPLALSSGSYFPKKARQIEEAGFQILDQREAFPALTFLDIAGVVFYLKVISWQIKDFSVEKYRDRLYQLHQVIGREGGFEVKQHRYLLEAKKCSDRW
jgi:SAM-dependent methyltransferase